MTLTGKLRVIPYQKNDQLTYISKHITYIHIYVMSIGVADILWHLKLICLFYLYCFVFRSMMWYQFLAVLQFYWLPGISGHGRLIDPPSRSSMWRYGFNNPPNYDDNQLYCGGVQVPERFFCILAE